MIIVTLIIITFIIIITSIVVIINYLFIIIIIVLFILIIYDFLLRKWSLTARRNSPWKHPYVIGPSPHPVFNQLTGWFNDHLAPHLFPQKKIRRLLRISHPFHHPRHPPFFHRDTSFSSPKKKRMAHLPLPIRPANSCTLPLPQSKVSTARSVTSGSVSPSSVSRISNEAWFLERRCSFHPGGSGFFSGRYLGEI